MSTAPVLEHHPVGPVVVAVGPFDTVPNAITAARTVLAVGLGAYAVVADSTTWLLLAYVAYWGGDVLDGWAARRLDQETRAGAVLDIVADRACSAVLCGALLLHQPQLWPAAVVFLLQFMVLDCALSLSFLGWDVLGPNDFHRVDRRVWRWNWSPPAKAVNTAGVVVAVAAGSLWPALAVATAQLLLKAWSAREVAGLLARRTAFG